MEFPYGHNPHHHRHSSSGDDDDDGSGRYPPPGSAFPRPGPGYDHPPPPPYAGEGFHQPPPSYPPPATAYPPPPPAAQHYSGYPPHQAPAVKHVSHDASPTHHSYYPHMPSFPHHHSGTAAASAVIPPELAGKPTFKVYCKANPNFALAIRDEKVVLALANPSDPYQHWYKDEKYSTRVKDEEGSPCFALVNQATGLAVKHSVGASHPVQLIPYDSDRLDESVLWAMSKDLGDGYRTIRMVNNIHLNVDAFHGDKKSEGIQDGTTIVLWQWNKGENQLWKITPYCV